ncbi:MAG: ATP-binding protein [Methylobacteriaceae bacterium]|nr:ATP-binding protein [Methylobacteriaceae bacterium]
MIGASGQAGRLKEGVLADALNGFSKNGRGGLEAFIGFLADLPEGVSRVNNAARLASAVADQLRAAIAINPLLNAAGQSADPGVLFGPSDGRTRISVINFAALQASDSRQDFVNQLQMALFTWIKNNPSPSGRLYVLDEAQNFAPPQSGTACKASARGLAAQARKYGLGMIFATQAPKGIDNTIVSNCTTHFYGRVSSPTTIDAAKEMMAAKGGAADDLGRLERATFYFATEGLARPVKVRTPLCLSYHPQNPLSTEEIAERARRAARRPASAA